MKIKSLGALRDASYMYLENREQKQSLFRQPSGFQCGVDAVSWNLDITWRATDP